MTIEEIPDKRGGRYPERILLAVSKDMKKKIEHLKQLGKDTPEFLRKAIEEKLDGVEIP